MPGFNDIIRNEVVKDIFGIWQAAGLLIISYSRIQTKFNDVVAKFEGTKKWAKVHKSVTTLVLEEWLDKIYNIIQVRDF